MLEDAETGEVIPNDGIASNMTILIHGKGEHCLAEFISFGGIYLAEGVRTGRNRDVCDFAVFIGNITEDDITICILHFDGSTGQGVCTGEIGFGQGDVAVNKLIKNSFRKLHSDDFSISCFAFRSDGNGIALGGELPSIRRIQFADVIIAMRIAAGKG